MRGATIVSEDTAAHGVEFQSTRPVRGATHPGGCYGQQPHISIHAPRAGRDPKGEELTVTITSISIHAPRAGRDPVSASEYAVAMIFQSTRPVRGATMVECKVSLTIEISIHAPRAGRDSKSIQNYFTHFCDKRQFLDNFTQNAAF